MCLAAAAVVVAGCGSSSHEGRAAATAAGSTAQANAADRAFGAQMIPHHKMAVQMARTAQQEAAIRVSSVAVWPGAPQGVELVTGLDTVA